MDINWQYNNPSNPAEAALGPQKFQKFWDTCDGCSLTCLDKEIDRCDDRRADTHDRKLHRPNHDVLKIRTVLTWRDISAYYQTGWKSLREARCLFGDATPAIQTTEESEGHAHVLDNAHKPQANTDVAQTSPTTHHNGIVPAAVSEPPNKEIAETKTLPKNVSCGVCHKSLRMPCWYCTCCTGTFAHHPWI